jgi:hypothetical protein
VAEIENGSMPKHSIEELRKKLAAWLSIPDTDQELIDLSLAAYASHRIAGDPVWLIFIDGSGAGKTELLRSLRERKDCYFLSKLTQKSLVSGYREKGKKDEDPSLLPQFNEKIVIIKDFSAILSMHPDARTEVFGELREGYDGFCDQGKGNLGRVSYESRFTLLTAATPAIDRAYTLEAELGERFLKVRARGNGSYNKTQRALHNLGVDGLMRNSIQSAMNSFLDALPKQISLKIPSEMQDRLSSLADFTAKARSHVQRDRQGNIEYPPRPEAGTRLVKELGKLLVSLAAVHGKTEPTEEEFATIERVADDCLPPFRFQVIKAIRDANKNGDQKGRTQVAIQARTKIAEVTVRRTLEDLEQLGAAFRNDKNEWELIQPGEGEEE